jgi:thiol-disulfide isomerase/thioredoxin
MGPLLIVSTTFLWVVVLFNLILTLALIRRFNAATPQHLKKGEKAPDFTAETLSGETLTRDSYAGRGAAYIFFSPWCGPCKQGLPKYEELAPIAARSGVDIVLVSTAAADPSRVYFQDNPVSLPVLIAPKEQNGFMEDYKATGTPFFVYVDAAGKVRGSGHPTREIGDWKRLVDTWEAAAPQAGQLASSQGN